MNFPASNAPVLSSVNLSVSSLDPMIAWYAEKLGCKLRAREQHPAMGLEIAFLQRPGLEIEMIEFAGSVPALLFPDPPGHARQRGITHVGFGVADLDAEVARLKAGGVEILFGPKTFEGNVGIRVAFFRDPEGNLLKVIQRLHA